METWCRLCATEKFANELLYVIDDEYLNIKQKLIDCCRWDKIAHEAGQVIGMPRMICNDCFERLEQCWLFAESVMFAQQKIRMHTVEMKPIVLLQIEKVETPFAAGADENAIKTEVHEYAESIAHLDFDFDDAICELPMDDYRPTDTKDVMFTSTDEPSAHIDCDLLALLSEDDKNEDGTVNKEKIGQLKLDDWSILKAHCWICKTVFNKHRTFKSHFRTKHAGQGLRFHCTLCNLSTTTRSTLQSHMIKTHRSYLQFW